jgi:hypothetical protein
MAVGLGARLYDSALLLSGVGVLFLADAHARTLLLGDVLNRRATPHQQQRTQDFHGSHHIATKSARGKLDHAQVVTYRHGVVGRQPPSGVGHLAMTDATQAQAT